MNKSKIQKQFFSKLIGGGFAKADSDLDHVYLASENHWSAKIPREENWLDLEKLEEEGRWMMDIKAFFSLRRGEPMGQLENEYRIFGKTLAQKLTFPGSEPVWVDAKVLDLFEYPMVFSQGGLSRVAIAEAGTGKEGEINIQAIVMPIRASGPAEVEDEVVEDDDDLLG